MTDRCWALLRALDRNEATEMARREAAEGVPLAEWASTVEEALDLFTIAGTVDEGCRGDVLVYADRAVASCLLFAREEAKTFCAVQMAHAQQGGHWA